MSGVKFETERLLIREFTLEDVPDCFLIYSRPEVQQFLKNVPVQSHEEMQQRLEPVINRDRGQPYGVWAAVHKVDGRVIGSCILKPLPGDSRVEVGWHYHPDYWGQGFASEGGRGALKYGFETRGLDEVFAILLPGNERSRNVAKRIGMTFVETTRQFHDLDLELHRISREEYEARS